MKLLIEIPEKTYHMINTGFYDYGDMNIIIRNGIPLDKIRSEIEQRPYGVANDNVIQGIKYERAAILEIFDKYKAESEE